DMRSHLVGAANRAEIQKLRHLEEENAALTIKLERQQRHLREAFTVRDEALKRLNESMVGQADETEDARPDDGAAHTLVVELNRRLSGQAARTDRLQHRLHTSLRTLAESEQSRQTLTDACDELRLELERVNDRLAALLAVDSAADESELDLGGSHILYVGGRPNQVPQLRALVERVGG